MTLVLHFLPVALVCGMVLGLSGSREFKRGLVRGALNFGLIVGGMVMLAVLVQLATDPAILGG